MKARHRAHALTEFPKALRVCGERDRLAVVAVSHREPRPWDGDRAGTRRAGGRGRFTDVRLRTCCRNRGVLTRRAVRAYAESTFASYAASDGQMGRRLWAPPASVTPAPASCRS